MDLFAVEETIVEPGRFLAVAIGLSMAIEEGWEGQIRSVSSLAAEGVTILNSPGTIDSDFRGEVRVILINLGDLPLRVSAGMKIAQMVIAPAPQAEIRLSSSLSETERNDGGFGSTGST